MSGNDKKQRPRVPDPPTENGRGERRPGDVPNRPPPERRPAADPPREDVPSKDHSSVTILEGEAVVPTPGSAALSFEGQAVRGFG
jgi:hypothetical protein